jgi:hypothetical protein
VGALHAPHLDFFALIRFPWASRDTAHSFREFRLRVKPFAVVDVAALVFYTRPILLSVMIVVAGLGVLLVYNNRAAIRRAAFHSRDGDVQTVLVRIRPVEQSPHQLAR